MNGLRSYSLSRTQADVKGTAFQTLVGATSEETGGVLHARACSLARRRISQPARRRVLDRPSEWVWWLPCREPPPLTSTLQSARPDMTEGDRKDAVLQYARTYIRGIDFNPDLALAGEPRSDHR